MSVSVIIEPVFSWFILILGLSYLFQSHNWIKLAMDIRHNIPQYYLSFLFFLLIGLLVLATHNEWLMGWEVIITLIGWILVIKSTAYLLLTNMMAKLASAWLEREMRLWIKLSGLILSILGAILVYQNCIRNIIDF